MKRKRPWNPRGHPRRTKGSMSPGRWASQQMMSKRDSMKKEGGTHATSS